MAILDWESRMVEQVFGAEMLASVDDVLDFWWAIRCMSLFSRG